MVSDGECEPIGVGLDRQLCRVRAGVARHVRERLLSDSVHDKLRFAAELRHRCLDLTVDAQARPPSESIAERGQRTGESEVPERLGPKVGRDAPDVLEAGARRVLCLVQLPAQLGRQTLLQAAQLKQHGGQRLPDFVVQFLGDSQPFGLVRVNDAAGGVAPLQFQPREHLVERHRQLTGLRGRSRVGNPLSWLSEVNPAGESGQCLQRREETVHHDHVYQRDQSERDHQYGRLIQLGGGELPRR